MTTKKEILQDLLVRIDDRIDEIDKKFKKYEFDSRMERACRVFDLLMYKTIIERELWADGILKLCRTGK